MYVLIVSPPIPRLLYWSENCVEVRGAVTPQESSESSSNIDQQQQVGEDPDQPQQHLHQLCPSQQQLPNPYHHHPPHYHSHPHLPQQYQRGGEIDRSVEGYPWGSRDILYTGGEDYYNNDGQQPQQDLALRTNQETRPQGPHYNSSNTSNKPNEAVPQPSHPKLSGFEYLTDASRRLISRSYCLTTMCASKKLLMITTSICACASFAFLCIAVATDYWLFMVERIPSSNSTDKLDTYTGLWRRCFTYDPQNTPYKCDYIDYMQSVDVEGLGPTEHIIVSFRRFVMFPILALLILVAGQIVCFMGHCNHRKKILTFVAGIIFVVGGLCILVGIILFIGAITEEAGHTSKAKGMDEPRFEYTYGSSFVLNVASFIISELTGVLSVYLYISRHKHAYKKKQERVILNDSRSMTNSRSNFHGSRSLSRERSHDNSPSHSDTYYTYTPVSESSKEMSNYTFPRDPSRYTLPDTHRSGGGGGGSAGTGMGNAAACRNYPSHAQSSHSMHDADTYASRREMDHYSRSNRDMDTYSRRTTPV